MKHRTARRRGKQSSNQHSRVARLAAKRRAEAARRAAIARRRAEEAALRDRVQAMIARDDIAGEDAEIRRAAVKALGNHAGTVVVMDPKTGRVYSIVNQEWALHEGFKPCSTIKLVTGLAGLNERVIDPADTAAIANGNRVSLTNALAHSKNEYFQTVGGRVGFSKMISYARQLGLGEKTGINASNEFSGRLPDSKAGFALNHMSSHGDDFKVTAVQLATLVSAMANGGKLLTPFVPRTAQDKNRFVPKVRRNLNVSRAVLAQMVPGMVGAVSYGSGHRAFNPREVIAGKTGTCIEGGGWVGLFTSYAPLNDPRIAIAVIARGSDGRDHFPAAVAGQIYRELSGRFAGINNSSVAKASEEPNTEDSAFNFGTSAPGQQAADDEEESDEAGEFSGAEDAVASLSAWNSSTISRQTRARRVLGVPNENTGRRAERRMERR